MRLYGLLKSQRISNFMRSRSLQLLESDVCAQTSPGEVSVLRPSVPGVNGAGYENAAAFKYGFWALVGSRFGPMVQPGVTAWSLGRIWLGRCCIGSQTYGCPGANGVDGAPAKVTLIGGPLWM